MTYKRLRKRYDGYLCRYCINQHTHRHIRHTECRYFPGYGSCASCGREAHIVKALKLRGKIKLSMD